MYVSEIPSRNKDAFKNTKEASGQNHRFLRGTVQSNPEHKPIYLIFVYKQIQNGGCCQL